MCFANFAYGNEPTKRIHMNGCTFIFSGGAVVYRYKNQSMNTLSSTEAELIAAVTAAKTSRFLRYMYGTLIYVRLQ